MANKVKFGLSNVHIFPITGEEAGAITYGPAFELPGAVSLSLEPSGESEPFYADNIIYYESTSNNGYEGELTVAKITEDFETKILGFEKTTDGAIVESAHNTNSQFGMAFEFSGDANKTRHILYNCSAQRPKQESATIEDKKTPSTDAFSFKAMPDKTGAIKARVEEGHTKYSTFYTAVYRPTEGA